MMSSFRVTVENYLFENFRLAHPLAFEWFTTLTVTQLYILDHLSRRLIGELIIYALASVHPSSSSYTMLKHFLGRNR